MNPHQFIWRLALGFLAIGASGCCCGEGVDAVWTVKWEIEGKQVQSEHKKGHTSCPKSDQDTVGILGILYRSKGKACREHCASKSDEACVYQCDRAIKFVTRTCEERRRPWEGIKIPIK